MSDKSTLTPFICPAKLARDVKDSLKRGTAFQAVTIVATAGLGMNYQHVYFADNRTGQFGYYDAVGFSVGVNVGITVETGFAESTSPVDLATGESLSASWVYGAASIYNDSSNRYVGWSGGGAFGPVFDVGVSANSSEPENWVNCSG